jgi:DNA transformation protein
MDDGGSFAEHALDLTVRVGPPCDTVARLRRMFSGQGIFCDGVMFALVADDTLYLKGDDDMKPAFLDAGSSPFTYEKVRGEIELPPDEVGEDVEKLLGWAIWRSTQQTGASQRSQRRRRKTLSPRRNSRS